MSKISDELREFAYLHFSGSENVGPCDALMSIADRIDAEMVELPRDRDGVPIHVGDTVYGEDGMAYEVVSISFGRWDGGVTVHAVDCFSRWRDLTPGNLAHAYHDSWERIADELDEMVDAARSADDGCEKLADFAERIRRLAGREGER